MAVTGNPLQVGISGLLSAQRSLSTVSHNVTNVNTDGYSRQRTEVLTNQPTYSGAGYVGNGVYVSNTSRIYSSFVNRQVQANTASSSYQELYHTYATRVDNLLADPNAGLNPAMQAFFDAAQGVADDPVSVPARQVLLTEATTLENRFHIMQQRLQEQDDNINQEMADYIGEINSIASEIASINKSIASSPGLVNGKLPNDLFDRRDQLLVELSDYVDVQAVQQDNFTVNVYIGNGQTLVTEFNSVQLQVTANQFDTSQLEVGYPSGSNIINVSSLVSGGKLGAIIDFRENVLHPTENSMGRIAIALTEEFNAQHKLGMDLNSELGQDFFSYLTPGTALPNVNNNPLQPTVDFSILDPSALTDSDYRLKYNLGSNDFDLIRLNDNTTVATAIPNGGIYPVPPADVEGFQLNISLGGTLNDGDTYLVRPTEAGARTFTTVINDTAKIAAAAPIRVSSDLNNLGNGEINLVAVTDTTTFPVSDFLSPSGLNTELHIEFIAAGPPLQYDIWDAASPPPAASLGLGPFNYDPTTGTGTNINLAGYGFEVQLSKTPKVGDIFTVTYNSQGTSDNRNMLELAGLQTDLTMLGGNASFQDAYGQMVSTVGSKTHQADLASKAAKTLLQNAIDTRESISGVNLDEEASDMLRFQQAYNAAAQIISTSNQMMDELIAAIRS